MFTPSLITPKTIIKCYKLPPCLTYWQLEKEFCCVKDGVFCGTVYGHDAL